MENSKELKKQNLNKDFINFIKTKKAKLSSDPVNYEDDEKQNPFKKLKESKKVFYKNLFLENPPRR